MKELIPARDTKSFQERLRSKLSEKFQADHLSNPTECLLLDVTGSMWGRPIERLREATRAFSKSVRRFCYNETCWELASSEEIPEPLNQNYEHIAFTHLKAQGIQHVIMITDGGSNSPEKSLKAAIGLKIDIIYIGPPPRPKFLEDLAKATGGSFDNIKFDSDSASKLLNTKIRGLLPAPPAKKAIEL